MFIVDYLIYLIISATILYLLFKNIRLKKTLESVTIDLLQANIDRAIIENSSVVINDDNFVTYLSKSREEAYTYIEELQSGVKSFVDNVSDIVNYYNQYGAASLGIFPPYDSAMKTFSDEVKKLENFLPKENND